MASLDYALVLSLIFDVLIFIIFYDIKTYYLK